VIWWLVFSLVLMIIGTLNHGLAGFLQALGIALILLIPWWLLSIILSADLDPKPEFCDQGSLVVGDAYDDYCR
jgi:hypothetical protein